MAEVECTTTTAKSKMIQLTVEEAEGSRDRAMEWSFNGMSADDLTQVTLETTLLRKRDPIRERDRAFLPSMPDPLRPLREATVADEIVRPLAELLIVDELVGSGRAARVTDFRLGASVGGKRRLQLTWEPPRRYTNQRAERRTIDGQVEL